MYKKILVSALSLGLLVTALSTPAQASGSENGWSSCSGVENVFSVVYGSGSKRAEADWHYRTGFSSNSSHLYSPMGNGHGYWYTAASDSYSYSWSYGNCG